MKKTIFIFLLIFHAGVISSSSFSILEVLSHSKQVKIELEEHRQYELAKLESSELSIDNVAAYLSLLNIDNKDIIFKQILLESGWLKSQLTLEYNNLLGMKLPSVRPTVATGKALGHATYNHWTDSIKDYILWQNYWTESGLSTHDYYQFLSQVGYATATYYIPTLKRMDIEEYSMKFNT